MDEKYENQVKDCVMKFSHNQEVEIIKGFYKNYQGIVTGYFVKGKETESEDESKKKIVTPKKIYYNVHIESLSTTLLIDEQDLKEVKKGFFKKIFSR